METHINTGKIGEDLAARWLICQGYQILFRNFRLDRLEVDLIVRKKGILHFVEVKTSRSTQFGFPEDRISRTKQKSMVRSVRAYLNKARPKAAIQIDVLSVMILKSGVECFLFENVF